MNKHLLALGQIDDEEYQIIANSIVSARIVENLLWGELNDNWGLEEWKRMFRKRNLKIDDIKVDNPHWKIELKKRLLQNAALSVALIKLLDDDKVHTCRVSGNGTPSNLHEYKD
jgi:hypothetical protein